MIGIKFSLALFLFSFHLIFAMDDSFHGACAMDDNWPKVVIPVSVINNSLSYAITVLRSSHHDGCYYPATVFPGHQFPPNDFTPNGLAINLPFKVITQKGPFVIQIATKGGKPTVVMYREKLPDEEQEQVGQEIIKKYAWFGIEATVEQDGSLSYITKECTQSEALDSEYYGKKKPAKTWGF